MSALSTKKLKIKTFIFFCTIVCNISIKKKKKITVITTERFSMYKRNTLPI